MKITHTLIVLYKVNYDKLTMVTMMAYGSCGYAQFDFAHI